MSRWLRRVAGRGGRLAALGLLSLASSIALRAPSASAHAIVLESVPAPNAVLAGPPGHVMLRFNSKIEKRLTRVTLAADGGPARPVAIADGGLGEDPEPDRMVIPLNPLPPGRYVIRYKVLSADGHVTEGTLRFTLSKGQ